MSFCLGMVREMSGNFELTQMWQPCTSMQSHLFRVWAAQEDNVNADDNFISDKFKEFSKN